MIHLLVDADGMPLSAYSASENKDERKQVRPLLEMIEVKTGKPGRQPQKLRRIAADKGYDSDPLRNFLKKKTFDRKLQEKRMQAKDMDGQSA